MAYYKRHTAFYTRLVCAVALILPPLCYLYLGCPGLEIDLLFIKSYQRDNIVRQLQPISCKSTDSKNVTKNFVYLIQTEACLPKHLSLSDVFGNSSACQCDLIVLSFKEKCKDTSLPHVKYIFDSSSTWSTGREQLYKLSLQGGRKYIYYIFMDDDVALKTLDENNQQNPWRLFEEFLLRVKPPVAAADTTDWRFVDRIFHLREIHGCNFHQILEYMPAVWFDGMFNAFHHDAAKAVLKPLLPHWSKFDELSWWFAQWYVCIMTDVIYHHRAVHSVEIMGVNPAHRPYARKWCDPSIIETIITDIKTLIPDEVKKQTDILLHVWKIDYESRRKGVHTYCLDPPQPGCKEPYDYLYNFTDS